MKDWASRPFQGTRKRIHLEREMQQAAEALVATALTALIGDARALRLLLAVEQCGLRALTGS
jgi:hypothetical protein